MARPEMIAMNRTAWYHHLRSGLNPMKASHAWTQALIYQGFTISPDSIPSNTPQPPATPS